MKHCFIIQPFDKGKFDKRFAEIIEPIVEEIGYLPYRVDRDESADFADFLVETIEKMIAMSEFCIAEITTNNPNVWYELGFAFAKGKKVIMLCSDERDEQFPFDIRHRNILTYATKAPSDFDTLKSRLRKRIGIAATDNSENSLSELEIFLLNYIYNSLNTPNEVVPREKLTVSEGDVPAALKRLVTDGLLEYIYAVNGSDVQSSYYRVTAKAMSFIRENAITERA